MTVAACAVALALACPAEPRALTWRIRATQANGVVEQHYECVRRGRGGAQRFDEGCCHARLGGPPAQPVPFEERR
jgi:hypothetical protein